MPQFNPWIHQSIHSNQLEHMYKPPKTRAIEGGTRLAGQIGYAMGGAVALPVSHGIRRFGQWYYPSEKINVATRKTPKYRPKSYTKTKKVCCRRRKGKTYCSPEFCEKRKKKYWY